MSEQYQTEKESSPIRQRPPLGVLEVSSRMVSSKVMATPHPRLVETPNVVRGQDPARRKFTSES